MGKLIDEMKTGVVFEAHDLGVIAEIADRVVVMYAGMIMEEATVYDLFENPLHPHTRGLLESLPSLTSKLHRLEDIPGNVPSLSNIPPGCPFHPRCKSVMENCRQIIPKLKESSSSHKVACLLYG